MTPFRMNKKTILALCLSAVFLTACSSKEQREFNSALKTAQTGDATAQMKVGDLYLSGTGTEQNIEQSVHWYKAAADQGTTDAFAWLMTQAYQGNPHADQVIRKMQQDGNIFLAHWVLDLAKKTHDPAAEYTVGWMYDTGKGLIQDKHQAQIWYEKAAKQKNVEAIKVLGNQHYFSEHPSSTPDKAAEYLSYAAEQGQDADAAMKMAHYYHYDIRDGEKARQWYAKAGALGDTGSQHMADTYETWKDTGPLQPNEPPPSSSTE